MAKKLIVSVLVILPLVGIGCPVRPDAAIPPPSEPVQVIDGNQLMLMDNAGAPLSSTGFVKTHHIGQSSCPDPFPTLIVDLSAPPTGEDGTALTWTVSGVPSWLDMPSTGKVGESVTPKFNCRITDYSKHDETASLEFRIEGHLGGDKEEVVAELEKQTEKYNLPIKPVTLDLKVQVEER